MKAHETDTECEKISTTSENVTLETVTSQNGSCSDSNSLLTQETLNVVNKSGTMTQPTESVTEKDLPRHKKLKVNHHLNNNFELQQEPKKHTKILTSPQLEPLTTKVTLNHSPSTKKKFSNLVAMKTEDESSIGPTEATSSTNAQKILETNGVSRSVLQVKIEPYKKYSCPVYDFCTKKKLKYKDHVEFHQKEVELVCSLCDFFTLSNKRFKKHLCSHENDSRLSKVPLIAQETLSDASSSILNSHYLPFKVSEEEGVDESAAAVKLFKHDVKKRFPKNGGNFIKNSYETKIHCCSICEYKTNKPSNLTRHDRVHTGKRPFSCTYSACNYFSAQKGNLMKHLLVRHSDANHSCKLCGESFKTKYLLNSHVINHTGKRPHQCLYKNCEYSSISSWHLKTHTRTHTKEKPHHCYYKGCGFSCSEGTTLKTHVRTHTGEKPYPCNFEGCNYSSTHSSNLKTHLLTHSKDKSLAPFSCNFCKKSFAKEINLLNHLRNHTGQKIPGL